MNSKMKILFIFLAVIMFSGLFGFMKKNFFSQGFPSSRATYYGDVPKSKRLLIGFGDQISHEAKFGPKNLENDVKDYLVAGMDPNYCLKMYDGWQYRNPLMLFCSDFLSNSYYKKDHIRPNYDMDVFNQLIAAGADVNRYPYVWAGVYLRNSDAINIFETNFDVPKEEMPILTLCYISDCNRVLEFFLTAGADVNKKGSPTPFNDDVCEKIREEKIQEYFNSPEATTPLYEAIKKGMVWESQVDLLLKYGAILDDSCLEAAKLSGDDKMILKVQKLLEETPK